MVPGHLSAIFTDFIMYHAWTCWDMDMLDQGSLQFSYLQEKLGVELSAQGRDYYCLFVSKISD